MSEDQHIFLGLGSNVGNRYQNLKFGVDMLNAHPHIWVTEKSHVYQSPAMYNADQDEFYNVINTNYVKLVLFIENIIQKYHHSYQYLSIIVFSSIAGERGRSYNYIYGSSKSALTQYLSGLRQKYNSSNINIITMIPGYIKTKMLKNKNTNIFLTTSTNKIADIVYNAYMKKKDVVYTPFWFFISVLIKIIPEFIYKKLKF